MNGKPSDSPTARDRALTEVAFTAAMDRIAQLEAELAEARTARDLNRQEFEDAHAACLRTQAEAAAMRAYLETMAANVGHDAVPYGANATLRSVLTGDAGRAIAERVPLWRELERLSRRIKTIMQRRGEWDASDDIDVVLRKLAALDEKGGGE